MNRDISSYTKINLPDQDCEPPVAWAVYTVTVGLPPTPVGLFRERRPAICFTAIHVGAQRADPSLADEELDRFLIDPVMSEARRGGIIRIMKERDERVERE